MISTLYICLAVITITAIVFFILFLKARSQAAMQVKTINELTQSSTLALHEKDMQISEASTKLQFYSNNITKLEDEIKTAATQIKFLENQINQVNTQNQLINQQNENLQKQMADFEETKRKHLEASKASMLEISTQLSNKLLEDHKRESNQIKKEFEENFKKSSEDFSKNYQTVFEAVKSLNDQVKDTKTSADFVKNALLSPTVGGSLAEITLENILVAAGLIENKDYTMQASFATQEGARRPDAVVYLPAGGMLAIDAKTSIFFARAANSDDGADKTKHEADLKFAVNNQFNDLKNRDYKKAIIESYKAADTPDEKNVTILMFLPTEAAIEKIQAIDKNFMEKAWKEKIFPVGPSGLINLLIQSKLMIDRAKQEKNYEVILAEVKKLIDSVATMQGNAAALGKGLEGVVKKYNAFAGGFNVSFGSKVKKITELGLKGSKENSFEPIAKIGFSSDADQDF
jgi:DNA recombination protein RmuC